VVEVLYLAKSPWEVLEWHMRDYVNPQMPLRINDGEGPPLHSGLCGVMGRYVPHNRLLLLERCLSPCAVESPTSGVEVAPVPRVHGCLSTELEAA